MVGDGMQGFFIERLDGNLVNIANLQSVYINPDDDTNVTWRFNNGETLDEDLVTAEEALARLSDIRKLLLGVKIEELEERIIEQENTITEQNERIEEQEGTIDEQNDIIETAEGLADDILGNTEED